MTSCHQCFALMASENSVNSFVCMYGYGFLSRGFTDWREILHGGSAWSRTGLLLFWGDSPRDCRILSVSKAPYGGICFLLKHIFLLPLLPFLRFLSFLSLLLLCPPESRLKSIFLLFSHRPLWQPLCNPAGAVLGLSVGGQWCSQGFGWGH